MKKYIFRTNNPTTRKRLKERESELEAKLGALVLLLGPNEEFLQAIDEEPRKVEGFGGKDGK